MLIYDPDNSCLWNYRFILPGERAMNSFSSATYSTGTKEDNGSGVVKLKLFILQVMLYPGKDLIGSGIIKKSYFNTSLKHILLLHASQVLHCKCVAYHTPNSIHITPPILPRICCISRIPRLAIKGAEHALRRIVFILYVGYEEIAWCVCSA